MRTIPPLLCALAVLAVGAPAASAQSQIAPPGNAGVDEYLETVPGGGGNKPVDRGGAPGGRSTLPPKARKRLEGLGKDGAAAAALADAAAPDGAGGSGGAQGSGSGASTPAGRGLERAGDGGGGLGAVIGDAVGADGGGMGAALPVLLILTLLGAVALTVLRRRRPAP